MKRHKSKKKTLGWGIKKNNGTLATEKEEILDTWATFCQQLFKDLRSDQSFNVNCENESEIPSIIMSKIDFAIKNLKSGKAPGIDRAVKASFS